MFCEDCKEWFVTCPCCDVSFCPRCDKMESDLENEHEESEE
jgi:phage terminase large subunit GpA-like protein